MFSKMIVFIFFLTSDYLLKSTNNIDIYADKNRQTQIIRICKWFIFNIYMQVSFISFDLIEDIIIYNNITIIEDRFKCFDKYDKIALKNNLM